ncbi:MAG: 5-formyltetrahydrofolate cyclo-ligase [Clostridia bacterium]|nr:5-formyltetrahydrofolate cyclo-ligase [Clostridia bacterium]
MELNTVDKSELRSTLLRQRHAIPQAERDAVNQSICQKVVASTQYHEAENIFIYWSTEDEIDTHAIIADALRQGKRVCVPKCLPGHVMEPRQILSEADLTEETFGIPEPGAHCEVISSDEIQLCIVPALACDSSGTRLGYGGGFYDRFLPKTRAYRMALCAQARILETIPVQPHDVRCDCIMTETEVMLIHER